ncbi:hypothetical protein J2T20_003178 [Paenibacillus wynnii]|nr:hypothetical protein [Paenibacillus wynnii]
MKRWPKDTIAAGRRHTVGLKSDGTVTAVGDNKYGQCDVSGWRDIVAVAAGNVHMATNTGNAHTIGLKSDGTVAAVESINLKPSIRSNLELIARIGGFYPDFKRII